MRVLIWLRKLDIGGGQVNAVNLAEALAFRGHQVFLAAEPGALVEEVKRRGIPFYSVPYGGMKHPNLRVVRDLISLIRHLNVDIVHGIEGTVQAAIETYAAGLLTGRPVLQSWQGNWIPSYPIYYPKIGPLTVSAKYLIDDLVDAGWPRERIIYWAARIRTDQQPCREEIERFKALAGLHPGLIGIVLVSRIDREWNFEYLKMAILAAGHMVQHGSSGFRLVLVGDGEGRADLEAIAKEINERVKYPAVGFVGAMLDPMPAYAAADIVIGRSSSLLRAMALGKPCVAVGNNWMRLVSQDNLKELEYYQYWRNMPSDPYAPAKLADVLARLIANADLREEVGLFAKQIIEQHYDLRLGVKQMEAIYQSLMGTGTYAAVPHQCLEIARSALSLYLHRIRRRIGSRPSHLPPLRAGAPYDPRNRVILSECEPRSSGAA